MILNLWVSLNEVIQKSKIAAKSYLVAPNPNFAFRNLNICSSDSRLRIFYKGGKRKENFKYQKIKLHTVKFFHHRNETVKQHRLTEIGCSAIK